LSKVLEGSAIAGLVAFVGSVVLFVVVRLLPDDLSRGILLTFIGAPVVVLAGLWVGWVAAVKSGRLLGVVGAVVAVVVAVLFAAILVSPLRGINASTAPLILAGLTALSTAAGYLICAAGLPDRVEV
jgi:hypothetical protein